MFRPLEHARHLDADLSCFFQRGAQLRLKIFDLDLQGLGQVLGMQKLVDEPVVAGDLPVRLDVNSMNSSGSSW